MYSGCAGVSGWCLNVWPDMSGGAFKRRPAQKFLRGAPHRSNCPKRSSKCAKMRLNPAFLRVSVLLFAGRVAKIASLTMNSLEKQIFFLAAQQNFRLFSRHPASSAAAFSWAPDRPAACLTCVRGKKVSVFNIY